MVCPHHGRDSGSGFYTVHQSESDVSPRPYLGIPTGLVGFCHPRSFLGAHRRGALHRTWIRRYDPLCARGPGHGGVDAPRAARAAYLAASQEI